MKTLCLLTLLVAAGGRAEGGFDHDHQAWTDLLAKHVSADRIDYAAFRADSQALDTYLASLEAVGPEELGSWSEDQRYAFWINVYNAYTVRLILDHYPVKSIKDIGGLFSSVWDKRFIPIYGVLHDGEKKLSLNEVEHEILRPRFEDARVHAAVNCASESCPPLLSQAYVAERLDEQLDAQVRAWLADPTRNRYDLTSGRIQVSKIFDWFKKDFRRDSGSVEGWIAKYAPAEVAEWIRSNGRVKIRYLDYSWKLNDVRNRD